MMGHYCLWYFKTLVSVTTRALKKYIESIISKKPEKQKTDLKKKQITQIKNRWFKKRKHLQEPETIESIEATVIKKLPKSVLP